MYQTENAKLVPNRIAVIFEEDLQNIKRNTCLFRDTTNLPCRELKVNRVHKEGSDLNTQTHSKAGNLYLRGEGQRQNEKEVYGVSKLGNLLAAFDSDEYNEENQSSKEIQNTADQYFEQGQQPQKTEDQQFPSNKSIRIPTKNSHLLQIDSEDEEMNQCQQQKLIIPKVLVQYPKTQSNATLENAIHYNGQLYSNVSMVALDTLNNHQMLRIQEKKDSLLHLQLSDKNPTQRIVTLPKPSSKQSEPTKLLVRLSSLINRFGSKYYLSPIPQGAVLQCVIKRDRSQSITKYLFYDCFTLHNFMTIFKDSQGFLAISKVDHTNKGMIGKGNQRVIGRVASNFFGTQFNCMLQDSPYDKDCLYPINKDAERIITIEYETNILGLNGPRKLFAYIPKQNQQKYQPLNEVYSRQKKKKERSSVLKFRNKTPVWCKEATAYILNFKGRATVSSIKNFIMVGQKEQQSAAQKVLFGKFGKELFNLDVRYPFCLLQAAALAISSFDRKIACQ